MLNALQPRTEWCLLVYNSLLLTKRAVVQHADDRDREPMRCTTTPRIVDASNQVFCLKSRRPNWARVRSSRSFHGRESDRRARSSRVCAASCSEERPQELSRSHYCDRGHIRIHHHVSMWPSPCYRPERRTRPAASAVRWNGGGGCRGGGRSARSEGPGGARALSLGLSSMV